MQRLLMGKQGRNKERVTLAFIFLALAFLMFMPKAHSSSINANQMTGYWLVEVQGTARERVLQVSAVETRESVAHLVSKYGWIDEKWAALADATLREDGEKQVLHFVTGAGSVVDATYSADDSGFFQGVFRNKNGVEKVVRLTRTDEQSLKREASELDLDGLKIRKDSLIDLLVLGAPDCVFCREWKNENLQQSGSGFRASKEWNFVRTSAIDRRTHAQGLSAADPFPDYLQDVRQQLLSSRYKSVRSMTPAFAIAVDGKIVKSGIGKNRWKSEILPFIEKAVALKLKAGA